MQDPKDKLTLLEILQIIPLVLFIFLTGFVAVVTFTALLWIVSIIITF